MKHVACPWLRLSARMSSLDAFTQVMADRHGQHCSGLKLRPMFHHYHRMAFLCLQSFGRLRLALLCLCVLGIALPYFASRIQKLCDFQLLLYCFSPAQTCACEVFWLICYFFYSFQDGSATGRHNQSCYRADAKVVFKPCHGAAGIRKSGNGSLMSLAAFDSMRMANRLLTRGCLTSKTSETSVRALEPLLQSMAVV